MGKQDAQCPESVSGSISPCQIPCCEQGNLFGVCINNSHPRFEKLRQLCLNTNDSSYFIGLCPRLDDTEIANMAVCMIHQTDTMLFKLTELLKQDFLTRGGAKEEMYRARLKARTEHHTN